MSEEMDWVVPPADLTESELAMCRQHQKVIAQRDALAQKVDQMAHTIDGLKGRLEMIGQDGWMYMMELAKLTRERDEQAATIERLTEALNYWGLNNLISDPKYRRRAEAKLVRDRIDAALNYAKPSEPKETTCDQA